MVEGDSSARKRVLYRGRDASGITIGGDGNRPRIVHLRKGGAYVLSDGVRIANFGDMTVLYVPPHRRLRRHVLRLRPASAHILGSQPLDYDGDDDDDDLAIYEHYRTDCVKYIYIYIELHIQWEIGERSKKFHRLGVLFIYIFLVVQEFHGHSGSRLLG